jgi:hypothetical protein
VRGNIGTVNSLLRPKRPLLPELENLFWLGLQIFRAYGAAGDQPNTVPVSILLAG